MNSSAATKECFARSLRRLRAESMLKQSELAEAIGVSGQSISLWERGKTIPGSDKIWALADYFGISVAEVLGKVETVSKENIPPNNNFGEGKADV